MEGGNSIPRDQIISSVKTSKMIAKGCLYHVVRVKGLECELPFIESVIVVRGFQEVFPNGLSGVPPNGKFTLTLTCYQIRLPFHSFI